MVHVFFRLDFESGNSLTELKLNGGGVRWISVQKGGGSRKREIGVVNATARSRCCVWGWGASVSPFFPLSFSLRLCL